MGYIEDDLIISLYLHRWGKRVKPKKKKLEIALQTHGISHINLKDNSNTTISDTTKSLIISIA